MSKVRSGSEVGLFVREMIGLDREAANEPSTVFLLETLTANQIQFVNLVIDYSPGVVIQAFLRYFNCLFFLRIH